MFSDQRIVGQTQHHSPILTVAMLSRISRFSTKPAKLWEWKRRSFGDLAESYPLQQYDLFITRKR